jgi:tetratricopeptide (TPR) repeat protein
LKIGSYRFVFKILPAVLILTIIPVLSSCTKEVKREAVDPQIAIEHYSLGIFYKEIGEDSIAAEELSKALENDPGNIEILTEYAFVLAKLKRFGEAEEYARAAIENGAQDVDLFVILGNGAKERGEKEKAVLYYKKAIGDTTNYFLVLNCAQLLRELNDFKEAISLLTSLKARFPFDLRVHTQLGDLYGRMEQFDRSAAEFREALLIDSLYYPAILGLGIIFEITGQVDSSLRYYDKAIQLNPSNMSLLKRIVEFEILKGEWEDAKDHAEMILAVSPTEHSVRKQLAYVYYHLNEREEALEQYLLLSGLLPKDAAVFHFLGRLYYHRKEYEKAKESLLHSRTLNSEFIPNYEYLFLISIEEMDETNGRQYFNAMRERNIDDEEIYFTTGNHLYREQEYAKSKTFFIRSVKADPNFAPSWYSLGFVYDKIGDADSSEIAFRRVLELDPNNANTMNALGYLFTEKGIRLQEAEELIGRALEQDPLNGYYIDSMAWLYYMKGDFKKARELLLKALELVEDAVIYDHLGDVHRELGDDGKAYDMWLKALELDPGNEDIMEKINLHIREKTPTE